MKVLLLHAYSRDNAGDGLLVEESLQLLRDAFGAEVDFTIVARRPETFEGLSVRVIGVEVGQSLRRSAYATTIGEIDDFDLVAGVGGGYLRFGRLLESIKSTLVHLPQLRAASQSTAPTVYLPQSVGPLKWGTRLAIRRRLGRLGAVFVRDDRSFADVATDNVHRVPDLALLADGWAPRPQVGVRDLTVLTVRDVSGASRSRLRDLARALEPFEGYVQSVGGGNDDRLAMQAMDPLRILNRDELLGDGAPRRIVVAVRLHAALMALRAGHWVVHLAYERKGFGAFEDLGLGEFVHGIREFDTKAVRDQVAVLHESSEARRRYDEHVEGFLRQRQAIRDRAIGILRGVAGR